MRRCRFRVTALPDPYAAHGFRPTLDRVGWVVAESASGWADLPGADPVGNITRGTTNPNRLRRVDRWLAGPQAWRLRPQARPLVVDLGYGGFPDHRRRTVRRLASRCARTCTWRGIEIEPDRVRGAKSLETPGPELPLGGFELPVDGRPSVVRAFNVLRQYEEADVAGIWAGVCSRLAPGGIFVDGTCDEIGRRSTWVALDGGGPLSLTHLAALRRLRAALRRGRTAAQGPDPPQRPRRTDPHVPAGAGPGLAGGGAAGRLRHRQRWVAACASTARGRLAHPRRAGRWRLGELTVAWSAVEPGTPGPEEP